MAAVHFALSVLSVCVFLTFGFGNEIFSEEYKIEEDMHGRELVVASRGRIRKTIDLNDQSIVAKTMCKDNTIKVSLASDMHEDEWKIGDLVVGSSALDCRLSFTNPDEGVFGKITYLKTQRKGLLYITVENASPLDVLEEANISLHVKHRRTKRSNTNFLSNILDSINWEETSNTTVLFNKDKKPFSILKMTNNPTSDVGILDSINTSPNAETHFNFTCTSCFGKVELAYHLEMRIKRDVDTNKPIVKSYLSQVEGETTNYYQFSIQSHKELTLLVDEKVMETDPLFLHPITLATFKRFPPLQLTIRVQSSTYLSASIITHSSKEFKFGDTFQTSGKFVVSNQHSQHNGLPTNHISTYDWQTNHVQNDAVESNDLFSMSFNISQQISLKPFIEWVERDIRLDFGSPFTIRLQQELNLKSTVSDVSLCSNVESRLTSAFSSERNSLVVDAFGIPIWGDVSTLTMSQISRAALDQQTLSRKCQANCFESQSLSTSIDACGAPGSLVLRNSSTFSSLRKLFGDTIIFLSEEASESSWCGHPGNPCLDCSNYIQDDNVCSDRYVTPELAEVLTKLAKFVEAEWPDRKLLILEAWDEATSAHPLGSHGNQSLFYTGRAARVALSKNLTSKEPETDQNTFQRFTQLLQCSDADFFDTYMRNSVLDICVSDESAAFFTNTENNIKKRAIKSNNIVKTNTWRQEKDKYDEQISGLVSVSSSGSTLKDYFGGGKYYPSGKTAIDVCGEAEDTYSIENLDKMQRQIQYPLENVAFEAEGAKTSSCGAPTRGCNQCTRYVDVDNPWDWCLTRTLTTRAATRLHRLARLVEEETKSGGSSLSLADEELGICRSAMVMYETLETCIEKMPSSTTNKESKCYDCMMDARCCYGNDNIGCIRNECSGDESSSVWTSIACSELNPFLSDVTIPTTPACNDGDSSKMILYGNVCGGDPCQFFTGIEYHLLLKVVLIFEVCSGKWDQTKIDQDIRNLNTGESNLMTFLSSCMGSDNTILKLHYPVPNDPTIGIGFSLRSSEKKDLLLKILPNLDYDLIMEGKQSLTKEQALYLYDKTMRRYYIKTMNSIVPFKSFIHLDTATKIALVNANYRGEFPSKLRKRFNTAVQGGQWANAANIYLSHPDYKRNKCDTTGHGSICTRMTWNAEQFNKLAKKQVKVLKRESSSALQNVGRSLKLTLTPEVSLSTSTLANLAVIAGFDHVTKESDHIVASVRPATGVNSVLVNYPNVNMHETEPPVDDMVEYEIPAEADYSLTYPLLLDGFNDSIRLSDCYKIADLKSNKFRYFRFDPTLLECMEEASSHYTECIAVESGSGYRVRSENNRNIDSRHSEEKWRFSVGQAVEIGKGKTLEELKLLGLTVIRSCVQNLIRKRLILGIGAHKDKLYVDVRESSPAAEFVKVWEDGSSDLYTYLKDIENGFKNGGAFIEPTNKTRACQPSPLGKNSYYIKYSNEGSCSADTGFSSLCSSTKSERQKAAADLLKRLDEVIGNGPLDKASLREKVNNCLVNLCGGCIGKGKIWRDKTIACFDFVTYFLDGSSVPFPNLRNSGAFFNTENTKSEVHSLACHDGSACIENVQLHSLLQETLTTKYKPDSSQTNEELVYDPMDNPSPLLNILEQEMAMRVSGNVSVYIENNGDISRLNQILKILMVFNTKVTNVHFHLTNSVRKNQVVGAVQRKIERWATSTCPDISRVTVAPFTVSEISHERHKRSIDNSQDRNFAKQLRNNWELEWLSKT